MQKPAGSERALLTSRSAFAWRAAVLAELCLEVRLMEMMNIDAAIRMFENYKIKLECTRKVVLQTIGKTYADPDIARAFKSLRENFEKLFRSATVDSIILHERMTLQLDILLNFPSDLARLNHAAAAFYLEFEEALKALLQIEPTYLDPKPDKSAEATSDCQTLTDAT
jgi:hypothetical protein